MSRHSAPWMSTQTELETGRIVAGHGRLFKVRTAAGDVSAHQAFGCLVAPRPGDAVLVAVGADGKDYILSVLERDATVPAATEMILDGPVNLRVQGGSLALQTDGDLRLASRQDIACASRRIAVAAHQGRVRIGRLAFVGRFLSSQVARVKSVALGMDVVCRRLTQRLGNSFRYVKELDETQSTSSRVVVEDLLTMHSKNTLIMSEEHVTVNAEQIQLG
ncbi:MAG: DUF3540 domain-containing protein [Acidobacteria bacterium]|nr:DUF3540 domain-containing protein [Acidobacteriota bacterium]